MSAPSLTFSPIPEIIAEIAAGRLVIADSDNDRIIIGDLPAQR